MYTSGRFSEDKHQPYFNVYSKEYFPSALTENCENAIYIFF